MVVEGGGILYFFFGLVNFEDRLQQDFIKNPKVQIGQNRLRRKIRTGWDKIQVGPDSLGKGCLSDGLEYPNFCFGFVDFGYRPQHDFIENPKVQIGQNRL